MCIAQEGGVEKGMRVFDIVHRGGVGRGRVDWLCQAAIVRFTN